MSAVVAETVEGEIVAIGPDSGYRRPAPRGAGAWRPAAPFIAQIIAERSARSRLASARADAVAVMGAYGSASALFPKSPPRLDRSI